MPEAGDIGVIVACEMLEDETRAALELAYGEAEPPPVIWIESSLHERPTRLQTGLEAVVGQLDDAASSGESIAIRSVRPGQGPADAREEVVQVGPGGAILFAFGYCGGGLKGIASSKRRLVFPRVDDCISLLLQAGRPDTARDARSYYLTRGWFCHNSAVSQSRDPLEVRYGAERAAQLRRLAFANYERVSLIDTGAYDVAEWEAESRTFARELELDDDVIKGSIDLLVGLFTGAWQSDDIVVLEPGEPVGMHHLFCGGS